MKYLLAALALAWATAAFAGLIDNSWPPDRYRDDATVTVTFLSKYADLTKVCGDAPQGFHINGCTTADGHLYLPNPGHVMDDEHDYRGQEFAKLVSHELAHHNGWPGDHPR